MLDKIEIAFRNLISAIQVGQLYPAWHPQFKKAVDKAFESLQEILKEREDLTIGIVGEEIAFEKEIFFQLSKLTRQMILYLKERGIEKIQIMHGLNREELERFISLLVLPKEEVQQYSKDSLAHLGIRNIIVGKIGVPTAQVLSDKKDFYNSNFDNYENSVVEISNYFDLALNQQELDHLSLRLVLKNFMDNLLDRHQEFLNLAIMKRYDVKTFYHVVNVSILSMYFSAKLGFSKEDVLSIGTAALFHDIGKMYITRKIIKKPARLSEEEFSKIKSHVIIGSELLLKYVDNLGMLPVIVCFEHHLRYDLKGYPKVSFYRKPHIASLIVSICDVYDALCQKRTYKSDYPPNIIYELMNMEKGSVFEPTLLDRFFKIIGVWPLGTIVLLTDQRIGVVREQHEDDIFSPTVEVIFPEDRKEFIDLRQTGGKNKIECFLNPIREGKKYLPLIYPGYKLEED